MVNFGGNKGRQQALSSHLRI
ncbi:hypothetical protein Pint_03078 [Pistacia integerrima]|uniref:Uncharacterized protein n=1 Tax=Pistacia integerrima TaxID=434235 RepID=A0ACC0ZNP4_9ROSI|nr:hypothetical protein Pint_03078 [Pistacia integerrima]